MDISQLEPTHLNVLNNQVQAHFCLKDRSCAVAVERTSDQSWKENIHELRFDKVSEG